MTLITILGPTAVGKTKLAVQLADKLNGEIISADSRQVYKGMDLGTGKDLDEYLVDGQRISNHLIDIKKAGTAYNVFDFQQDFYSAFLSIQKQNKQPLLCGGTGLYVEAALAKEKMLAVPENKGLRIELEKMTQEELNSRLEAVSSSLHNKTDTLERERTIRAIEIEEYKRQFLEREKTPVAQSIVLGICMERETLREQIEKRLKQRFEAGMVEEVKRLLDSGITHEQLRYYGLEYRFISLYLANEITYNECFEGLLQAIRRFAKKQMTWFRRMEKRGQFIHWLNAENGVDYNLVAALEIIKKAT